jgi:hypothetical protein
MGSGRTTRSTGWACTGGGGICAGRMHGGSSCSCRMLLCQLCRPRFINPGPGTGGWRGTSAPCVVFLREGAAAPPQRGRAAIACAPAGGGCRPSPSGPKASRSWQATSDGGGRAPTAEQEKLQAVLSAGGARGSGAGGPPRGGLAASEGGWGGGGARPVPLPGSDLGRRRPGVAASAGHWVNSAVAAATDSNCIAADRARRPQIKQPAQRAPPPLLGQPTTPSPVLQVQRDWRAAQRTPAAVPACSFTRRRPTRPAPTCSPAASQRSRLRWPTRRLRQPPSLPTGRR